MVNNIKVQRRKEILHIINDEKKQVSSQQELIIELKQRGFKVTQSTISRDLKALNIDRESSISATYHVLNNINDNISVNKMVNVFRRVIVDMIIDEKLICIKTIHGMAPIVGEMIDCMDDKRIAGTVASGNTVFTLCRSNCGCKQVLNMLMNLLNNKEKSIMKTNSKS